MLKSEISLFHYYVGYTRDIMCTNSLERVSSSDMLYRLLKERGYERIVFFKNNGEKYVDQYFDKFSQASFIEPKKASQLFDRDNVEKSKQRIIKECKVTKKSEDLFNKQQSQEIKITKTFHNERTFIEILKSNILTCIKDNKIKTAIVLPSSMQHYLTNIFQYIDALNYERCIDNIIVFTFENVGDLSLFGHRCQEVFPPFKKVLERNQNQNEDLVYLYKKIFGDSIHFLNPPSLDEISNLIENFLVMNDFRLQRKQIDALTTMINDDIRSKGDKHIPSIVIDPNAPLYSVQNILFNRDGLTVNEARQRYTNLLQYLDKFSLESANDQIRQYVGMEEFIEHINYIQKEISKLKRNEVELKANDLMRIKHVKDEYIIPDNLKMKLNLLLLGNPGTGKTTIVELYAKWLKEIGVLKSGHVVKASKADLKGEYIGQSAANMRRAIREAEGGVLFLDEIYNFQRGDKKEHGNDFEQDIIHALLTAMTDPNVHVVFVGAGYEKRSLELVRSYEGLESRFGSHILLHDYDENELLQIMKQWVSKDKLTLDKEFDSLLLDFIGNWLQDRMSSSKKEWANVRTFKDEFYTPIRSYSETVINDKCIPTVLQQYYKTKGDKQKEIFNDLDGLIGLNNVKERIRSIINSNRMLPKELVKEYSRYNFVFAGNPGVGKTMVARKLGRIAKAYHIVPRGKTYVLEVQNMLGKSNASELLHDACMEAIGGILFIDEAYRLDPVRYPRSDIEQMYNDLMQFMDNHKGELIIILAGYKDEMKAFLKGNPGTLSRISMNNFIDFDDYSTDELLLIEEMKLKNSNIKYHPDIIEASRSLIEQARKENPVDFGNARYVENMINGFLENMSNRISLYCDEHHVSDSEIEKVLQVEDVKVKQEVKTEEVKQENIKYAAKVLNENLAKTAIPYSDELFYDKNAISVLLLNVELNDGRKGAGTGFIISDSGLVLTCAHVVKNTKKITARLTIKGRFGGDHSYHDCKILKIDENLDMALLQLEGSHFPTLKLARHDYEVKRGEDIALIGYPLALQTHESYTNFEGKIASNGHHDKAGEVYFINSEAKQGNSGSPVILKDTGEVIGILCGSVLGNNKDLQEEINYIRPIKYFWSEF